MGKLTEANSKTIDGTRYQRSDFLVVEDPEKPSTWHLPVKKDGKPDRRLAGAAWAALYSEKGFRGNRYEGPKAGSAKRALRALYKAQEWPIPTSEDDGDMSESYDVDGEWVYTYGAVSFSDLEMVRSVQEMRSSLFERTAEFTDMLSNILYSAQIGDKLGAMRALFAEYTEIVGELLTSPPDADETDTQEDGLSEAFAEQVDARAVLLEAETTTGPRDPLRMHVIVIEPGWGNTRDGHYYPRDMLHENARAFVGAKMYASGHGAEGRTVRNEVSVIEEIVDYTETGAPIARVAVFDPDFAEQTRNRAKAGHLGTLECSILAKGRVKEGLIDGRTASVVEAITSVQSVDWVTRAGAGGRAVGLTESEETDMNKQTTQEIDAEDLSQEEQIEEQAADESQAPEGENDQPQTDAETQEATTRDATMRDRLAEAGLSDEIRERFAQTDWANVDSVLALAETVASAIRIAQAPGAPFANGPTEEPPARPLQEQADELMTGIFRKHGLRV